MKATVDSPDDSRLNAVTDAIDLLLWAGRAMEMTFEDRTNARMWTQVAENLRVEGERRLNDARALREEMAC